MNKNGNKILKITFAISLFFCLTMIPAVLIAGELSEDYVILVLGLWLFLFIGFGLVGIILLFLGYRPDEPKLTTKSGTIKDVFSAFGPVVMRISALLWLFFLFLILVWCAVIKEQKIFEVVVKLSFSTSTIFGVLSFILLLCCTPKESNSSEIYQMHFDDFTSYYEFMKNVFENNKFKRRFYEETRQGCEIYVYKKQRVSIDYYFILNLKDWSDESALVEFERFRDEILNIESFLNFGTVKVTNIICVNENPDNFEQKLFDKTTSYRRWTNLCIGVVFDEGKICLPSCKQKGRISLMKTMKREFRERIGVSEVISKNLLIRWIVDCCMEEKRIKHNAVVGSTIR
ncbi:MAG: hypothetical protein J6D06_03090 [Clostridia bacterium]|nr:hypothetical protein [Clostridia bacterium]